MGRVSPGNRDCLGGGLDRVDVSEALSAGAFLDGVDCNLRASLVVQETCDRLSTAPYYVFFL